MEPVHQGCKGGDFPVAASPGSCSARETVLCSPDVADLGLVFNFPAGVTLL